MTSTSNKRSNTVAVPVTKVNPRSCKGPRSFDVRPLGVNDKLEHFRDLLCRTYDVALPPVEIHDQKKVKEFCAGLLEPCVPHPWKRALRRAPIKTRIAVSASTFLFRKVLPSVVSDRAEREYAVRMSTPQPNPDPSFVDFVRRETRVLFPLGWDQNYGRMVNDLTLKTSSTLENSRKNGGARGWALDVGSDIRENMTDWLRGLYSREIPNKVRVGRALTAGKTRIVTKSSSYAGALSPVHKAISEELLKRKNFVRGEVDAYVGALEQKEGEIFVSGDYESATDNLNSVVSHCILEAILGNATHIPETVKRACIQTLSPTMEVGKESFQLRRGQLMGQYLSFPLLSLTNYFAFRYLVPREGVPVLINGDDIVFRATKEEYCEWAAGVSSTGLKLSVGKTMVKHSWFSINSTFFRSSPSGVELVPIIRASSLYSKVECADSINGTLRSVARGLRGESWVTVTSEALKLKSRAIIATQRSVTRGLGCRVNRLALERSGLFRRERFYLSLPDVSDPPVPMPKKDWQQNCVPQGWRRERRQGKVDQSEFFSAMIDLCWKNRPNEGTTDDYWSMVRKGTFQWHPSESRRRVKKSVRMGLYPSVREALRAVESSSDLRISSHFETRGKLVWVPYEGRTEENREEFGPHVEIKVPDLSPPDYVALDFDADCLSRRKKLNLLVW